MQKREEVTDRMECLRLADSDSDVSDVMDLDILLPKASMGIFQRGGRDDSLLLKCSQC